MTAPTNVEGDDDRFKCVEDAACGADDGNWIGRDIGTTGRPKGSTGVSAIRGQLHIEGDWIMVRRFDGIVYASLVDSDGTAYKRPIDMAPGFEEMACRSGGQAAGWYSVGEPTPGY